MLTFIFWSFSFLPLVIDQMVEHTNIDGDDPGSNPTTCKLLFISFSIEGLGLGLGKVNKRSSDPKTSET